MMKELAEAMVQRTLQLREQVESLRFSTDYIIYNPLLYAWDVHEQYIRKYMSAPIEALFLGMNPGPFGMAQTGVPFGEITSVKTFLKLEGEIGKPPYEHPARPILGLNVKRSEVSGKRLWALFCEHYADSTSCFSQIAVTNYCPLVFMDRGSTGKNITPDKLPKTERLALETICDSYLHDVIMLLQPTYLLGVGKYAKEKFQKVVGDQDTFIIDSIIHPSPGNPMANTGWNEKTKLKLVSIGLWQE